MAAGTSRIDKYNPTSGGFRAPLGFNLAAADLGNVWAVALNASGQVVKVNATAGQTNADAVGVIVPSKLMNTGDIIDVMTDGEVVNVTLPDGTTALAAGTKYYANAANDGTWSNFALVAATNYTVLGFTVEASRLVVRVRPRQG